MTDKDFEGRSAPSATRTPVDVPVEILRWLSEWDQTKTGAALTAVVQVHDHALLDAWMRPTTDVTSATYSRCDSCGNLPNGMLWCWTLSAIARELGVVS